MFYALNKDGIRIDAYEADKNEQYTCPRELCEGHPGYECPQVDVYEI